MTSYFRESRNVELSVLYYLETCYNSDWTGITVVKTFNSAYLDTNTLPIVCIRLASTMTNRLEIGTTTLNNRYNIIIDIFATSDAQRLDLSDYTKDKLKDGWVHYDHSHVSGDNTTLDRVANGRDFVTAFISDTKLDFGTSADVKDKYRQNIYVQVRKSS